MGYNIHRWYGAGWGRYTQLDPATDERGIRAYAYADNNPTARVDPLGLRAVASNRYPTSSMATTVCENGRVVPFVGPDYYRDALERRCLHDCTLLHEQSHAHDLEISDSNVCKKKRDGVLVGNDDEREAYNSERRAYLISIRCLQRVKRRCRECADMAQRFIDLLTDLLLSGNIVERYESGR